MTLGSSIRLLNICLRQLCVQCLSKHVLSKHVLHQGCCATSLAYNLFHPSSNSPQGSSFFQGSRSCAETNTIRMNAAVVAYQRMKRSMEVAHFLLMRVLTLQGLVLNLQGRDICVCSQMWLLNECVAFCHILSHLLVMKWRLLSCKCGSGLLMLLWVVDHMAHGK